MTSHLAYGAVTLCALLVLRVPQAFGGAEVVVTSCDQSFIKSSGITRVVLGNDLDCTGVGGISFFRHAGSVNLAGFTITGGVTAVQASSHGCKVFSDPPGGTITGQTAYGIKCGRTTTVSDVTLTASGGSAVNVAVRGGERSTLTRVTIRNWGRGVSGLRTKIRDSVIDNSVGDGVDSSAIRVENSAITNNGGHGLSGSGQKNVVVKNSVVSGNGGYGIRGSGANGRVKVKDSDVIGNTGIGVFGIQSRVTKSTVTGNGMSGVSATRLVLRDSIATGNGTSPECGVTIGCGDIATGGRWPFNHAPRVRGTSVCDTSYDRTSGIPGTNWGVCTLD